METETPEGANVKMDPHVKAAWLAALRSGEYAQGVERLRSVDDYYCCLGVLCELAVQADVAIRRPASAHGLSVYYGSPLSLMTDREKENSDQQSDWRTGYLPYSVARWAGFATAASGPLVWVPLSMIPSESSIHQWRLADHPDDMKDGKVHLRLVGANDLALLTFTQIADLVEEQL